MGGQRWSVARLAIAVVLAAYVLVVAFRLEPAAVLDDPARAWSGAGVPMTLVLVALGLGWCGLVVALLVVADRLVDHFLAPMAGEAAGATSRSPGVVGATQAMVTCGATSLVAVSGLLLVVQTIFALAIVSGQPGPGTAGAETSVWRQSLVALGMVAAVLTAVSSVVRMTRARRSAAGT